MVTARAAVLLLATLASLPAAAGHFELVVSPSSTVRAGRVAVRVAFTNRGDETMRHVKPAVWFQDAWHTLPAYDQVAPDESRFVEVDAGTVPALPGEYTAVIAVSYTDRNGHPYTTLKTIPIFTGEPPAIRPLRTALPRLDLRRRGTLALSLNSDADVPVTAGVRLVLPDELGGPLMTPVSLTVPAGGQTQWRHDVRNAWAVPGSQYRIFALVDYTHAGRHISTVVPGLVAVRGRWSLSARAAQACWALPIALGLWYAVLQIRAARLPAAP